MKLARGTQIIRRTNVKAESDEAGFITSGPTLYGGYFCRYWRMRNGKALPELRTKSVSELTLAKHIVVQDSVPQEQVEQALKEWC